MTACTASTWPGWSGWCPRSLTSGGVPKAYPYYAYPRREGWEGLDLLADNPDPKAYLKKCHRLRHNKRLYRDFQAVFHNVGGPRSRLLNK